MKNTDMTEQLFSIVEGWMDDIISDHVEADVKTKSIEELESDTDDGMVCGKYRITVNDQTFIEVEASGYYSGFQDCGTPDSHYTRDVYFDEIQDPEYEVLKVYTLDKAIDQLTESEIHHE